jgi:hypothetical protein
LRGNYLTKRYEKLKPYSDYMSGKEVNFRKLKKRADADNDVIDAEWFGDGKWQINDELTGVEEEDWEVWADWFPS